MGDTFKMDMGDVQTAESIHRNLEILSHDIGEAFNACELIEEQFGTESGAASVMRMYYNKLKETKKAYERRQYKFYT